MVSMAKIVHSEAAPAEVVHYNLAGVEFDLSGRKSFESDDASVLSNAEAHPWLEVKHEIVEGVQGTYVELLRAEDDHFSALNDHSNDPESAAAAEAAKDEAAVQPVVLDAGKPQTVPVVTDGVAETLAADGTSKTSDNTKDKS